MSVGLYTSILGHNHGWIWPNESMRSFCPHSYALAPLICSSFSDFSALIAAISAYQNLALKVKYRSIGPPQTLYPAIAAI